MQRRIALALSLAFTTIVTFSVVALGANAGFFSDAKKAATTQQAQAYSGQPPSNDTAGALLYLAAVAEQTAQAGIRQPQPPRIITEYTYVYETPVPAAPAAGQPAPSAPVRSTSAAPAPSGSVASNARAGVAQPTPAAKASPTAQAKPVQAPTRESEHTHDETEADD